MDETQMNGIQHLAIFVGAVAMILAVLASLAMFVLVARPWLRAAANGAPLSFFSILGMRLRGNPPSLLIDAYVALQHDGVNATIAEVEKTYIVNRGRVRTPSDLVDLAKNKKSGEKEPLPT
jgi:uncharacterized protein YqfA (UPF0365 family)